METPDWARDLVAADADMRGPGLRAWAMRLGLWHVRSTMFACDRPECDSLGGLHLVPLSTEGSATAPATLMPAQMVLAHEHDEVLVEWQFSGGHAHVTAVASDPQRAAAACLSVMSEYAVDPRDEVDPETVPVTFWFDEDGEPVPMRRRLRVPSWESIAGNYPGALAKSLAHMMRARYTDAEGIALLHGPPGTGKTTAVRALAREWRSWCDVHVVIDPERLLGQGSGYLARILFGHGDMWDMDEGGFPEMHMMGMGGPPMGPMGPMGMPPGIAFAVDMNEGPGMPDGDGMMAFADEPGFQHYARISEGAGPPEMPTPRGRLLVLEDAGELVTSGARKQTGQALSRLLNLADGLLGQGTDVSVMVTTNEPVAELHPAISRHGRTWANLEFRAHTEAEARSWLGAHGLADADIDIHDGATLAELYAAHSGLELAT